MPDIRHALQIAASAEKIYPLVSTAKWIRSMVGGRRYRTLGRDRTGFFNRTVYRLTRKSGKSPADAEFLCETGAEWTGTRLRFHLEAAGSGTLVRFTHADWASETDYFRSCNTTWVELMFRLKAAAEGTPRGPLFLADGLAY